MTFFVVFSPDRKEEEEEDVERAPLEVPLMDCSAPCSRWQRAGGLGDGGGRETWSFKGDCCNTD